MLPHELRTQKSNEWHGKRWSRYRMRHTYTTEPVCTYLCCGIVVWARLTNIHISQQFATAVHQLRNLLLIITPLLKFLLDIYCGPCTYICNNLVSILHVSYVYTCSYSIKCCNIGTADCENDWITMMES